MTNEIWKLFGFCGGKSFIPFSRTKQELLCKLFYIKVVNQNNLCHPYYHCALPRASHCSRENLWRCCEKEILIIIFSAQLSLCILSLRRCSSLPLCFSKQHLKLSALSQCCFDFVSRSLKTFLNVTLKLVTK